MENLPHQKKVYRMKPPFLLIIPIVFVLVVVPIEIAVMRYAIQLILSTQEKEFITLLLILIVSHFLIICYLFVFCVLVATPRLELSQEGIVLYGADYRISTPWQNIVCIDTSSRSFWGSMKIVELKESALVLRSIRGVSLKGGQAVIEKRAKFFPISFRKLQAISTAIPLWMISKKQWEEGDLLRELQYYAPYLNISDQEENN